MLLVAVLVTVIVTNARRKDEQSLFVRSSVRFFSVIERATFLPAPAPVRLGLSPEVYSFDLVSRNPRVTACDMASVPLKDSSVHVVVFCLSLMGTNLADFLREAHRVLAPGGLLKASSRRARGYSRRSSKNTDLCSFACISCILLEPGLPRG